MGLLQRSGSVPALVLQALPQLVQRAVLFAVAQLGVSAEHTALAKVLGAPGAGAHLLAAGLQLLGQLFQTQQLGSALYRALGGQLCSLGGFGRVELGDLGSMLCRLAGLSGLGTDGGQRFTQGTLFRCGFAGLGGGKLELQALLVQLLVGVQGGGAQQLVMASLTAWILSASCSMASSVLARPEAAKAVTTTSAA